MLNNSLKNKTAMKILKEVISDCLEISQTEEIKEIKCEKKWRTNTEKFRYLTQLFRKILPLNIKKTIRFYYELKAERNYYQVSFSEKRRALDFLQYVLEKKPEIPFELFPESDWEEILKFVKNKFYCALLDRLPKEKLFNENDLKKQKEIGDFLKQNPVQKRGQFFEFLGFRSLVPHFAPNVFIEKCGLKLLQNKSKFQSSIIIDCGAFVGDSAYLFNKELNPKKIIAIEPDKVNFEILLENIKINFLKNIEPLQIAIGKKREKGEISLEGAITSCIIPKKMVQ